jgi:general secretion pathway protein D
MNFRFPKTLTVAFFFLLLSACVGNPAFREGHDLAAEGNDELALAKYRTAIGEAPGNGEYRSAYLRLRDRLIVRWLEQAQVAQRDGQEARAEWFYRRILDEDPFNARARTGIDDLIRYAHHKTLIAEAETAMNRSDFAGALAKLRTVLGENPEHQRAQELSRQIADRRSPSGMRPKLSATLRKRISIEFKEAQLQQIFEVLARTAGLNFVLDKDVRGDQRATIFLRDTTINDALNLLLLTNQLEQRVLDANSILIYPNTAAKTKEYQPLTVKTFFLSNIDAKTAAANLKTIIRGRDIVVDEKQNLITLRDTTDVIRMAEKLLAVYDQPEPEVMLEVTVLEVNRSRLLNLGIQWPDQISLSPLSRSGGSLTLNDLKNLSSGSIEASITPMTFNARKTDGDSNILANPRIRARNKETATIMIGDKIPNITTTSTSTGFVSENIQYIDVGLKLEVQPTIYADNEVAIKVALEVSSIARTTQTASGALAYQIGTRNASTVLRLKDGENQVLAGLIRDEEIASRNKVPGLGDLPMLGRIFGNDNDQNDKTEIILSITPRLIRNVRRPDFALAEFDSGSEATVKIADEPVYSALPETQSARKTTPVLTNVEPADAQASNTNTGVQKQNTAKPVSSVPRRTEFRFQGPSQVKVGQAFSVQLIIHPGELVNSIPLALGFDPRALEVTDVTEGNFLKQGKGVTNFSQRIDANSGQVFVTVTCSGKDGAKQPGEVVAIGFKALSPASSATVKATAIAPIGVNGNAIETLPPAPLNISITP